jgi:hypothetical protein
LVKDKNGDLLADYHNTKLHEVDDIRHTEIRTAELLLPEPSSSEIQTATEKLYEGVSESFRTESITKYMLTTITLIEKQHKGLWRQNSLDLLTK